MKHPPICLQTRSAVAGDVTRSHAAGLRKRHPRRHSAVPAEAASVGDELCCSAGVFLVKVRAHHSTPPSTPLVEGGRADRLQAGFPCLQVSARGSDISVTETITEMEIIDPALTETETETMVIYETEII